MIEVAIISGKGGTGKTTLAASIAVLAKNKVIVDTDVDAPDLHLLLRPHVVSKEPYRAMGKALIVEQKCTKCGICMDNCRFDAVVEDGERYWIDEVLCDGCKLCCRLCPEKAIVMQESVAGYCFSSNTMYGKMFHGFVEVGEENSGKLVTLIRQRSKEFAQQAGADFIIIDGPPGIGCPVNSTLTGVSYGVVVTEPSQSGVSDFMTVVELMKHFGVKVFVVINKYDISHALTWEIERVANDKGLCIAGKIPFDEKVIDALISGKVIVEYAPSSPASKEIVKLWNFMESRMRELSKKPD